MDTPTSYNLRGACNVNICNNLTDDTLDARLSNVSYNDSFQPVPNC